MKHTPDLNDENIIGLVTDEDEQTQEDAESSIKILKVLNQPVLQRLIVVSMKRVVEIMIIQVLLTTVTYTY